MYLAMFYQNRLVSSSVMRAMMSELRLRCLEMPSATSLQREEAVLFSVFSLMSFTLWFASQMFMADRKL